MDYRKRKKIFRRKLEGLKNGKNYKKECEKEEETKVIRLIKINKETFAKFKEKLDKENKTINGFFNEQIEEY